MPNPETTKPESSTERVGDIVEQYSEIIGDPDLITSATDLIADLYHYVLANNDSMTVDSITMRVEGNVIEERAETENKHGQDR